MSIFLNFKEFELNEVKKSLLIQQSLKDRVLRSKTISVEYDSSKFNKDGVLELYFKSKDQKSKTGKSWEQIIEIVDLSKDNISEENIRTALGNNLKVYCECPDFSYAGWAYLATKKDYSIFDENRPPNITNPNQQGTVCKHLLSVLNILESFLENIHKDIK